MPCNYLSAPRCGLIDKMIEPKVLKFSFKKQIYFLFSSPSILFARPLLWHLLTLSTCLHPSRASLHFNFLFPNSKWIWNIFGFYWIEIKQKRMSFVLYQIVPPSSAPITHTKWQKNKKKSNKWYTKTYTSNSNGPAHSTRCAGLVHARPNDSVCHTP